MIHNDIAADCELYPPEICPQEKETLNRLVNNLAVDPAISEYHVVFLQLLAPFYNRLYLLLTRDLTNHGIPSSFLFKSGMAHSATPLEQDGIPLSNSIILQKNKCVLNTGKPHVLSKKWIVEPENRRIEAEGVNFYPVIAATLQALLKTYDIPYSDPKISQWVGEMVTTADLCVEYFFLLKRYAQENGKKIKLVAWECGYLPNGLFFCCAGNMHKTGTLNSSTCVLAIHGTCKNIFMPQNCWPATELLWICPHATRGTERLLKNIWPKPTRVDQNAWSNVYSLPAKTNHFPPSAKNT